MKKATSAALALHSAIAGLGLLSPLSLFAQTTVTYADTQVSTTNRATTPANPLTVTLASGVATESGVISGDGSLAKTGAGTLKLGATNTYTGGTFLSAGTLELSADNALGTGAITVTGGGIRAGGAPRTLWNALFTSGNLTVGRLTTFAGTTTLNAATTIIASNPDGLANGDTTFGGVIGGNFGVTLAEGAGAAGIGSGYLVFSGANTYTGGTTLRTRLSINSDAALGATSGALTMDGGTLRQTTSIGSARDLVLGAGGGTFEVTGFSSFGGAVSGSGGITQAGGFLGLSGPLTYTGSTRITNGGVLKFGNSGAGFSSLQTSGVTIESGGLYFGDDVLYAGPISGAGHVKHEFAGTTILTGTVTHTGGTQINGGAIQIGDGGTTGSLSGDVALSNAGNLAFKRSDAVTFAGVVSGAGTLSQLGTGTLTLTGANTYTGGTVIAAGQVTLGNAGALGTGAVAVASGALLDASGHGFDLNRLSGLGRITTSGAYTASAAGDVPLATKLEGTAALTKTGAGTFKLSGTNTYSGGTTITGGLVNFATGANLGTGKITLDGGGLQWATGNTVDISSRLNALGAAGATFDTNGNHVTFAALIAGSGALTKTGAGTLALTRPNDYTGGTTINAGLIQFSSASALGTGNITINGGGLRWELGNNQNISARLNPLGAAGATFDTGGNNVTFTYALSGTGALTKSGSGTATLWGDNTYAGGTTISGGTLQVGVSGTTGSIIGDIANNAALVFDRSDALTHSGLISGSGSVTKSGAGTLTLTGTNTYSGGTTVNAGLINFTSLANFGTGNLTLDGGGLQWAPGQAIDVSSRLNAFGAAGATFHTNLNVVTLASVLTGGGALTKSGYGTLTLTNANTYGGGTVISDGQLVMGNAEALGTGPVNLRTLSTTLDASGYGFDLNRLSGPGTLTSSGAYTASPTSDVTLATNLTGTASLEKTGAATLTLSGTISHTGGTTISGGTLKIGDGGNTASITGNILNHAALVFDLSDAPPYSGVISGPGSVTKSGTGTLSLTGANTYAGGTTITRGTLRIGTGGTTGSLVGDVAISAGATLAFNRSDALTFGGAVSGAGTLVKTGAGTLTLTGASTYSGGTTLTAGVVNFADDANLGTGKITFSGGGLQWAAGNQTDISSRIDAGGSGAARLDTNGNNVTFASVLSGARTYIKSGAGILALTATNTYSGGTTITGGLINFATAANFGTARTTLNGGGLQWATGSTFDISARLNALGAAGATFDTNGNHVTLASVLSGAGALNKSGAGTLTLSGANTYAAGTTLNAGTLTAGHVNAFGTGSIRVNAGTLNLGGFAVSNALDVRGGSFTGLANYSGTQTVSGSANYSGAVGGTLLIASGGGVNTTGATFTGPATVQSGGTLTGTGTVASLTVQSGGTLAPGNSPGLLTVNGPLTLDSGSFTVFEIAGLTRSTGYDAIDVSGMLQAGGTLSVSFSGGYTPTASATFDFLNFTSFGGSFAQVNLPVVAGYTWNTSQLSIDGTVSLIASAIPEPSAFAALAGLGALAATCIGRRRR